MGTTTAIIHIGREHQFHSGIRTDLMVLLSENDAPYLSPFKPKYQEDSMCYKLCESPKGGFIPDLKDWFGSDPMFSHPITDMLLTFQWERSEASGEIEKIIENVDCDWKDYVWCEGRTDPKKEKDTRERTQLDKARDLMRENKFDGKIVITILNGISLEATKGIKRDANRLKTDVVILDENEIGEVY